MAKEILKKLEEGLHCSICLDTYTDPKQLQCNHVYCQQCLVPLAVRNQLGLTCPTCRQVTPIPDRGVAGLQPAFHINHLLEIMDSVQKLEDLAATRAPEGAVGLTPSKTLPAQSCSKHGEELKLYCETCDELICYRCALKGGKHQSHDYEELCRSFDKYKEEIIASLEPMEKQVAIVEKALTQLDARCGEISDQRAATEDNIHVTFRRLREVLDVRETELISQLDRLTQGKLKGLAVQRDEIEIILAKLNSHSYFMKESLSTNYEGAVLMMKTSTIERVKELTTPLPAYVLDPNTEADIRIAYPASANVTTVCQNYGEFTDTPECHTTLAVVPVRRKTTAVQEANVKPVKKPILTIVGVKGPWGIAVTQRGEVVVTEVGRHCVSVFSPSGEKLRSFGTQGSGHGQFDHPHGVTVDNKGDILVADSANHRVQKFTMEGEFVAVVGSEGNGLLQFRYPSDVAYRARSPQLFGDHVYVVDSNSHRVQILYSSHGSSSLLFERLVGRKGRKNDFSKPCGVACDSTGKVYVVDRDRHHIKVCNFGGEGLSHYIGGHGQEEGKLDLPYYVTIDNSNMVYVSEWGNNRVSVFTSEGQFVTSFGREGSGPGEFKFPRGVAVNNSGLVYVCDGQNNRVQVFHAAS